MSMLKKLLVVGGVLAVVGVTAWSAPKVSRTKQIRALLKTYDLDVGELKINPANFKIAPEKMAELIANGAFTDFSGHLSQYLVYGEMADYNAAENIIIELRMFERQFKASTEAAAATTMNEAAPATDAPADDAAAA